MRRRTLPLAAFAALLLVGCSPSSSSDDGTVKEGSGVALNPGGKPQTPEDAARQSAMQQQGNEMNDVRAKMAADEAAARAKMGGK